MFNIGTLLLNHKVKAFGIRDIKAGCTGYLPKRLLFKFKLARYSNSIIFNFKSAVSYDLKLFLISHVYKTVCFYAFVVQMNFNNELKR
jgi:hypothetical protein